MPSSTAAALPHPARQAAEEAAPPVRVVRGGRYGLRKLQRAFHRLLWAGAGGLLLLMIVGVIYSQAQVTRISGQIEKTRKELTNAQSTYDYLSGAISDLTSSTNLQQIAEGRLGLARADASQITYIKLQEESVVEKSANSAQLFWDGFRTAALSLIGSLDP